MKAQITHIGIKQSREKGFRYKRLLNSGIFSDKDTRQKSMGCQGPFEEWTSVAAKTWIYSRVKEQKEGKRVHIVCDCCDTRNHEEIQHNSSHKESAPLRINPNCFGTELVDLIKSCFFINLIILSYPNSSK